VIMSASLGDLGSAMDSLRRIKEEFSLRLIAKRDTEDSKEKGMVGWLHYRNVEKAVSVLVSQI
jgi:hypothetical protein